uniref:Probable H/ACA ribonucleoprotein complex subunit 1 isoform X2 n=1 Tax=Nicotiana tabacum TaxID=4097 RepID=A0A1S4BKP4_TOBAC|nr:PREDICTED: probable H/ACA ribonucleoprotein complex subunit 1 isoform X2 [Nicotiana tabacum]
MWEPLEEGLLPQVASSVHEIFFRYQPPIPADQVRPVIEYDYAGGRFNNGVPGYGGGRGYNGRGRNGGRGRGAYRGRGNNYVGLAGSMPIQGQGRGQGLGWSRGRGQGIKSNGPLQAPAAYV